MNIHLRGSQFIHGTFWINIPVIVFAIPKVSFSGFSSSLMYALLWYFKSNMDLDSAVNSSFSDPCVPFLGACLLWSCALDLILLYSCSYSPPRQHTMVAWSTIPITRSWIYLEGKKRWGRMRKRVWQLALLFSMALRLGECSALPSLFYTIIFLPL